jgi:preprotein translocase subunit SecA
VACCGCSRLQVTISTNMAGRGTDILLGGNPDYMGRLKLKELLLPKVVMTADEDIAFEKKGKAVKAKSWAADPAVFPCELSADVMAAAMAACDAAALAWGGKALTELDAEERLVFATEKVNRHLLRIYGTYQPVLRPTKSDSHTQALGVASESEK